MMTGRQPTGAFGSALTIVAGAVTLAVLFMLPLLAAETPAAPMDQVDLRINEFMADNQLTLEDPVEPGEFPDWIEIYNPGPDAVSLDGLFLTDNPANPTRFAISPGLTIPANGFLLFYADNDTEQGPLHLNFALNRNSGIIGLYNGVSERLIDSYTYGQQTTDVSEGRQFDGVGAWRFFTQPTPGATNTLLPPVISNVRQAPTQPVAATPVTVTAQITDDRGLENVTLYYSTTGSSLLSTTMTVGVNNTYTGVIPAQPDGTFVTYYLQATDIDALKARAPAGASGQVYRYLVGFQAPLLYINEFMADNESVLENPADPGDFPDWFELYNPGSNPVALDGLFLTDDIDEPNKFAIPNGLIVAPGGHLLFYADNGAPDLGPQHTNFQLSRDGEYIGLYGAQGAVLIDGYTFGAQLPNFSTGRYPDASNSWQASPCVTPGEPNTPCAAQVFLSLVQNP